MSRVVVFFDQEDVRSWPATWMSSDIAFAMTPAVMHGESGNDTGVVWSAADLSDVDHARCVAFARRALKDLAGSTEMQGLTPGLRVMTIQSVWLLSFLICRLQCVLPSGPWVVRSCSGDWHVATQMRELLIWLLPRIWTHGLAHKVQAKRPLLAMFHRWLVRRAARGIRLTERSWVVTPTHKLRHDIKDVLNENNIGMLVLRPTVGNWSDYRGLIRVPTVPNSVRTLSVAPFTEGDWRVRDVQSQLADVGSRLRDPTLAWAWSLYVDHCAQILPAVLALSSEGEDLIKLSGAQAVFAFEANAWVSAAVLEGAGRAGIIRAVLNHNTHPLGRRAVANEVLCRMFGQRTCNELVDWAGIWSPAALGWSKDKCLFGKSVHMQPVQADYRRLKTREKTDGIFRVLHAGTYLNWSDFIPWVLETAHEYLTGMEQLATAASGMDDLELIVRVRSKPEVDSGVVQAKLGGKPNVSVCDASENFLDQLAQCDLLVSHFSTTVEQALQMGKPVLLWGRTNRHTQFPGSDTPPTPETRSAVYVVRRAEDLPRMLTAIQMAHAGRPLTDAECAAFKHREDTASVAQWVRSVLEAAPTHRVRGA
jgi:hypothetical protein